MIRVARPTAAFALLLMIQSMLLAETASTSLVPLSLKVDQVPLKGSAAVSENKGLVISGTNTGEKVIRGYLVTVTFKDSVTSHTIKKLINMQGSPRVRLLPGKTWVAKPKYIPLDSSGHLAPYVLDIDCIIFEDGTVIGPRKTNQTAELLARF